MKCHRVFSPISMYKYVMGWGRIGCQKREIMFLVGENPYLGFWRYFVEREACTAERLG
jgi:hypothetical protein